MRGYNSLSVKKAERKSLWDDLRPHGTRQNGNFESYRGCSAFDTRGGLEPSGKFQLPLGSPSQRHVCRVLIWRKPLAEHQAFELMASPQPKNNGRTTHHLLTGRALFWNVLFTFGLECRAMSPAGTWSRHGPTCSAQDEAGPCLFNSMTTVRDRLPPQVAALSTSAATQ